MWLSYLYKWEPCSSKIAYLFREGAHAVFLLVANTSQWNITDQLGKSEWFDNCNRPSNLTQIGLKLSIFQPVWPWNLMDDLGKL